MIRREPTRTRGLSDHRALGGGALRRRLVPVLRGRERLAGRRRPGPGQRFAGYASGLAIMSVLVGVLKLAGAAVALAAVLAPPGLPGRPLQLLGVALGCVRAAEPVLGREPGDRRRDRQWPAAAVGVTVRAVLYALFFLAGAALFGVLAVWFHRRHHLRWTSAVAGLAGAPLLLGLLLAVAPAILGQWGLLPA